METLEIPSETTTQAPAELARYFRISSRTHHGIVFAAELARATAHERPVAIVTIADRMGLSAGYLEELARCLREGGIIRGSRGRHGGYRLAKSPERITMGELVRLLDGPVLLAHCQDTGISMPCPAQASCASRFFFHRLKMVIDRELDATTLADLFAGEGSHRSV
ncbi:Rrf2 family transcriptional regulator [Candidatus Uhrbacteria bacterium]|nr:Rrf2 family transcriptional regulator [Candidatus Uhrbacteria bacterium]